MSPTTKNTMLPDTEPQVAAGKVLWHFTMSLEGTRPAASTFDTGQSPPRSHVPRSHAAMGSVVTSAVESNLAGTKTQ